MNQARWDLVLQVLEGPLARQGEILRRGPVVALGANPGPGGLDLRDYRALEDRHAVLTVYEDGTVSIAPTGVSQVRLSPHPTADWSRLEPLRGAAWLSPGSVVHLGPVGRGVSFALVRAQPLDAWAREAVRSASLDAAELRANRKVPPWFVGGVVFIGLALALALVLPAIRGRAPEPLGPVAEGLELYTELSPEVVLNPALRGGFDEPFDAFVLAPSAGAAGDPGLFTDRARWDEALLDSASRSAQQHLGARRFFARLEQIAEDYAFVVESLREAQLPEVFAAIPYRESAYRADAQSPVCAKGYWQLMPEVAHRLGVEVRGCKLRGRMDDWAPSALSPPRGVRQNAPYVGDDTCLIPALNGCATDERTDLEESTRAAIVALREAWEDPSLRASGAAVALTIASHNAGYDDGRFGNPKSSNVLPAYTAWVSARGGEPDPKFIGAQVACALGQPGAACPVELPAEAQHYVYPVLAQHFLAVCYYAANYGDRPAFRSWRERYADGYCAQLAIPTSEESKKWM